MSAVDLDGLTGIIETLRARAGQRACQGQAGKAAAHAEIAAEVRVLPRLAIELAARTPRAVLIQALAVVAVECGALGHEELEGFLAVAERELAPGAAFPVSPQPPAPGAEGSS